MKLYASKEIFEKSPDLLLFKRGTGLIELDLKERVCGAAPQQHKILDTARQRGGAELERIITRRLLPSSRFHRVLKELLKSDETMIIIDEPSTLRFVAGLQPKLIRGSPVSL
jgi:hypothetical protein